MTFERKKVDGRYRVMGDMLHFIIPHYTKTRMKFVNAFSKMLFQGRRPLDIKVQYSQEMIQREDGTNLRMCIYSSKQKSSEPQVAVLWLHGGGYAMSEPEQDYRFFKNFIKKHNAVVFAPDYIKSVEKPFPAAFNDSRFAFEYIKNNAKKYNLISNNIFVGGDSAGAGLAFALSLYARDVKDDSISFLTLIYPMISHKNTQTSKDNEMPIWNTVSNQNAWELYIRDFDQNDPIFKYASPAIEKDFSNLPPVLTYVGTEDPFYAETVQLIGNLKAAGIKVDFKIFEGCFHCFDIACPLASKSREARKFLDDGFNFAIKNYIKKDKNTDEKN